MTGEKSRAWSFTSFEGVAPREDGSQLVYLCYQQERTKENKTHWQGYVYFKYPILMETVKTRLGSNKIHVEPSRGTPEENRKYCSKSESSIKGTFKEFGELPKQGKRNDLKKAVKSMYKMDYSEYLFKNADVASKYLKWVNECYKYINKPTEWVEKKCVIIHGPSGCGKSMSIYEAFGFENIFEKDWQTKWWDGYEQEPVVLWDEVTLCRLNLETFKKLTDGYPFRAEVKGSQIIPMFKLLVLITNDSKEEVEVFMSMPGIKRRINKVIEIEETEDTYKINGKNLARKDKPIKGTRLVETIVSSLKEMVTIEKGEVEEDGVSSDVSETSETELSTSEDLSSDESEGDELSSDEESSSYSSEDD